MDEGFMQRVKERIAAATPASTSIPTLADPGRHSVQTLEEWMASYVPDAKYRCTECKCPAVEGAQRICIGCGSLLPPLAAATGDPFIFDKSLTKKHFCGSVHLEYRDDYDRAPSSIKQTIQATLSGIKQSTDADGVLHQSHSFTESEVIVDAESSRNDEGGNVYTFGGSKNTDHERVISEQETNEEYASKSIGVHVGEPTAGIEILSPSQRESIATGGYLEGASSVAEASTPHTLEVDAVGMPEGVPSLTVGPHGQIQKGDSSWKHLEKDFDAFFQGTASSSLPTTSTDIVMDTSPLGLLEGFGSHNTGTDFDTFFNVAPTSGVHVEEKNAVFTKEARVQSSEDFDGFFQVSSNLVDQSHQQNLKTGDTIAKDGFGGSGLDLGLDAFFQTPISSNESFHQSAGSAAPNFESRGESLEVNLDQYFQSVATTSSNQVPGTPDSFFDYFGSQKIEANGIEFVPVIPEPANPANVQHTHPTNPNINSGTKPDGQDVQTEFDEFFLPMLTTSKVAADNGIESARPTALEDSTEHTGDLNFTDFFAAGSKPADRHRSEEISAAGTSAEEPDGERFETDLHSEESESQSRVLHEENFDSSVTKPFEGQSFEAEFDDFLQATSNSINGNGNIGLTQLSVTFTQNTSGVTEETDFEDFRQADNNLFNQPYGLGVDSASLNSAPGLHEQKFDTDFGDFFQVPSSQSNVSQKGAARADATEFSFPVTSGVAVENHKENGNAEFHDFFNTVKKSPRKSGNMEQKLADMTLFEQSSSNGANEDFLEGLVQTTPKALDTINLNQTPATQDDLFNGSHLAEGSLAHTSSMDFDDFVQAPPVPEEPLRKVETTSFDKKNFVGNPSMDNSIDQKTTLHGLQDAKQSVGLLPGKSGAKTVDFFEAPRHSADKSPGQNIETEFDHMFRAPKVTDISFDNFDLLLQTATQPASKVQDPSDTLDLDFFQHSAQSNQVLKHSGTAADDFHTVGGQPGNKVKDGSFSPSTETKNRKTKGVPQVKGRSPTAAAAFRLSDAHNLSDNLFSVDPARTAGKLEAPGLSSLFSDFLVFDDKPQKS